MRILQAGNANFGYIMAKELRRRGFEADLLISKSDISGTGTYATAASVNDPKNHDPGMDSYPDWVIFDDIGKKSHVLRIANLLKKYDIIQAYQATPIHAMLSGKPYIAVTGGDELRKKAFEKSVTGYLLKRAYKKADMVVYTWPVALPYIQKLGLHHTQYIPRIWDSRGIARKSRPPNDGILRIFMPTAQLWDLKGNEKFLRAFVRLCKEDKNIHLYYIGWGRDAGRAQGLLSEPKAARRTTMIPGPISREEMAGYMSSSDILADQFNTGSFTRMGIEAFHFGIPILVNLDHPLYQRTHGDMPSVLQCATENDIYRKISWSLENRDRLESIASDSQKWVMRHFDIQKNIDRHVELYQKILKK